MQVSLPSDSEDEENGEEEGSDSEYEFDQKKVDELFEEDTDSPEERIPPAKTKKTKNKRENQRSDWRTLRTRVPNVLATLGYTLSDEGGPQMYEFVRNVAQMYLKVRGDDDELHIHRTTNVCPVVTCTCPDAQTIYVLSLTAHVLTL